MGTWIKRREVVDGARRIRSEKLREHSTEKNILDLLRGRELNGMEKTMSNTFGSR